MSNPDTQLAQPHQPTRTHSRGERLGFAALGVALFACLALAAWLEPDPSGLGTHKKLGLPDCTMHSLLGIRCPGCGMTTAWTHTLNGDLTQGLQSNTAGVILCILAMIVFPWLLWLAIRGKPFARGQYSFLAVTTLLVAVGISFFEWLIRLALP